MENELAKQDRFKNIDFLRFILAIIIMLFHSRKYFDIPTLNHGNICVDFFFIIAGFFLFKTSHNISTGKFVLKRFLRLAPMVWILTILVLIVSPFINEMNCYLNDNLLNFLLLNSTGLAPFTWGQNTGLDVNWFISNLFWISIFYFYLQKSIDKKHLNLLVGLITFFSYILYYSNNHFGTGGHSTVIYNFITIGFLRGLGGIGISYFLVQLYNSTKNLKISTMNKVIISGIEICLASFLIYYIIFSAKLPGQSGFLFISAFSILFYLFTIKQGILSQILENDILAKLGKYTFSMYIMHYFMSYLLRFTLYPHFKTFIAQHNIISIILQSILLTIIGIITYYLIENPINKRVKIILNKSVF